MQKHINIYNMQKYINTLKICLLGIIITCGALIAKAQKPNVLFIAVDDLNDFPAFCHRYADAKTPNMDRLATRGTVFANAHTQFPLCGPSRASVMSGLYPSTLGLVNHIKDELLEKKAKEEGTKLLHSYFSDHGYETLAVGKICHHHVPEGSVDVDGGGFGAIKAKNPDILFGQRLKLKWHQIGTSTDWGMTPERDDQLVDFHVSKWAVDQLKAPHEKPFFLMAGFLLPHVPWYAPKKWFDLYDRDKITLPRYEADDLEDVSFASKNLNICPSMPHTDWAIDQKQWRDIVHAYLACISYVDAQIGKVLDALEASPYRDNTIVVLWSDHGYHMGEKNTFQKMTLWERSSHIPLIFAGPNIKAGQRSNRVVSLIDLYPTLLDICGLPANARNQGRSIAPLLDKPDKAWPYPAITGWRQGSFAIQTEQYRYLLYQDGTEELYDHTKDLDEIKNLSNDPNYKAIKAQLNTELNATLKRAGQQMISKGK